MPKSWNNDPDEWLTTINIEKVLDQYAESNKQFYFYGASPIDYDTRVVCDIYKLCRININEHITNGITKIGFVFNTDRSDQSGKHWISLYIDLVGKNMKHPAIYFFDSVGNKPPKELNELINTIRSQKKFKYYYNDIQHQEQNSECGIYCIHFLIYMLKNGNFKKYIQNKKSDKYISKYRYFFFNKI